MSPCFPWLSGRSRRKQPPFAMTQRAEAPRIMDPSPLLSGAQSASPDRVTRGTDWSPTPVGLAPSWRPALVEDVRDLFEHRSLLWSWTIRDIKIKYKQTVLGFSWAVLQPLLM